MPQVIVAIDHHEEDLNEINEGDDFEFFAKSVSVLKICEIWLLANEVFH